jgi:hypothetical protein
LCKPSAGNCSVQFFVPKLPAGLGSAELSVKVLYMLNNLGMDAVASVATITAPRRQYMRFSSAYAPYAYQVRQVAHRGTRSGC